MILICVFATEICCSQISPPSSDDNSVVYFVRLSTMAKLKSFNLYDSTEFIGKVEMRSYLRYECNSGQHLLWAQGEKNDFIKAELMGGKIYFIEVLPELGGAKWRVNLMSVYPNNDFLMGKIIDMIEFKPALVFTEDELEVETKNNNKKVTKALNRYKEDLYKGRLYGRLTKNMFYEFD